MLTKREIRQAALREIVNSNHSQKVEGCTIDPETARMILELQKNLKFSTCYKLMGTPIAKVASIVWATRESLELPQQQQQQKPTRKLRKHIETEDYCNTVRTQKTVVVK